MARGSVVAWVDSTRLAHGAQIVVGAAAHSTDDAAEEQACPGKTSSTLKQASTARTPRHRHADAQAKAAEDVVVDDTARLHTLEANEPYQMTVDAQAEAAHKLAGSQHGAWHVAELAMGLAQAVAVAVQGEIPKHPRQMTKMTTRKRTAHQESVCGFAELVVMRWRGRLLRELMTVQRLQEWG